MFHTRFLLPTFIVAALTLTGATAFAEKPVALHCGDEGLHAVSIGDSVTAELLVPGKVTNCLWDERLQAVWFEYTSGDVEYLLYYDVRDKRLIPILIGPSNDAEYRIAMSGYVLGDNERSAVMLDLRNKPKVAPFLPPNPYDDPSESDAAKKKLVDGFEFMNEEWVQTVKKQGASAKARGPKLGDKVKLSKSWIDENCDGDTTLCGDWSTTGSSRYVAVDTSFSSGDYVYIGTHLYDTEKKRFVDGEDLSKTGSTPEGLEPWKGGHLSPDGKLVIQKDGIYNVPTRKQVTKDDGFIGWLR